MSRPFQFSLKSLMVLVLVVAAFFAGVAVQRRETERVRTIAEDERARAEAMRRRAEENAAQARSVLVQMLAEATKAVESQDPDDSADNAQPPPDHGP
jgi:hypothetical protein